MMKQIGMGEGYVYDHETDEGFSGQSFWPEELEPKRLYRPKERGHEKRIAERLAWWAARRGSTGA
jgi:putative ATPase